MLAKTGREMNGWRISLKMNRRELLVQGSQVGLLAASIPSLLLVSARISPYSPLPSGPGVDRFKQAERKLLRRYGVTAKSRFVTLESSSLPAHVLEAGKGPPIILIHGGGLSGCSWAQLLAPLQQNYHAFAPDLPGCGLTYRIDFRGLPFRRTAQNLINEIMDALHLPSAIVIGHSMGGYFALVFALAHPERVSQLVLIGEPAGSSPPSQWRRLVRSLDMRVFEHETMDDTRHDWGSVIAAHIERVSSELLDADNAQRNLPGYAASWNSMLDQLLSEKDLGLTYGLKPELKTLRPSTLFIWGDKDFFGPPTEGQEMAALAPHARCEVVADAGHAVWIDQPDRCRKSVTAFLLGKS